MSLSVLSQSILADGLTSTVASDVIQDTTTGLHIREFRFFGEPVTGSTEPPLLLTVRAVAREPEALRIKTPAISV